MEIRISRESEAPLHQQLAEHFVYLIATGQLKAGEALPSVREARATAQNPSQHGERGLSAISSLERGLWGGAAAAWWSVQGRKKL